MEPAAAKRDPIPSRSVSDLKNLEDVVVESSVQDDRLSSRLCRFAGIGWSVRYRDRREVHCRSIQRICDLMSIHSIIFAIRIMKITVIVIIVLRSTYTHKKALKY